MKKTITVVTGGHGGMGKAICKELGKTSAIVLAGRWGHPYEMGALTAFLRSAGAGYVNGVDILADGGQNAGIFVPINAGGAPTFGSAACVWVCKNGLRKPETAFA